MAALHLGEVSIQNPSFSAMARDRDILISVYIESVCPRPAGQAWVQELDCWDRDALALPHDSSSVLL